MATILEFGGHRPRIDPTAWVAQTAVLIGHVVVEAGASVWYGAVLRGDDPDHEIRVGAGSSVQDNCVLHVSARGPTVIGPEVTVGHGAILESCRIERGALIGMNAVVLQDAVVGEGALIAAGAVVGAGQSIPAGHLAAGTPAVVKKRIEGASARWVGTSAQHYVELGKLYREAFGEQASPRGSPSRDG